MPVSARQRRRTLGKAIVAPSGLAVAAGRRCSRVGAQSFASAGGGSSTWIGLVGRRHAHADRAVDP